MITDSFLVPNNFAEAELKEKGSRFIARVFPVMAIAEVDQRMEEIRKRWFDATHHCFAYCLADQHPDPGHGFDAGEPAGTAGPPILRAIHSAELSDILIVVTRYYGGVKLGTGGLIRAYGGVAAEALAELPTKTRILRQTLRLSCDYEQLSAVYHLAQLFEAVPTAVTYDPRPVLDVAIRLSAVEAFRRQLVDLTGNRVDWQ